MANVIPVGFDSEPEPRHIAVTTLGCKINAYESRLIEGALRSLVPASASSGPDLIYSRPLHIINTCTVTKEADRQARQAVRRAVRQNPEALVVVTGCYAQMDPEACASIPGVDFVIGNDRKLDIHRLLPELVAGRLPPVLVGDLDQHVSLPDAILMGFEGRARAFVQIQQGCDQGCTFCIIHRARGPSRSLPMTLIRRQIERLVLNGYGEIVLCGVDLGSWGEDHEPSNATEGSDGDVHTLATMLKSLDSVEGDYRIRLSSIDPIHLTDELIDVIADSDRICPHIHLSMQSGCTLILKRMKRRATRPVINERIALLRRKIPDLTLSADVMTGFPTETDAHFGETLDAIVSHEIAWPHVFPYSLRDGTPAARIPKQVPVGLRKSRAKAARETGDQVRHRLMQRQIGQKKRVLVERTAGDDLNGVIARAADYFTVRLSDASLSAGQYVDVRIIGCDDRHLIA